MFKDSQTGFPLTVYREGYKLTLAYLPLNIVACQRGGVSIEPPWLRASDHLVHKEVD